MKKTLFLSAILGAALCSNAFATDYTISNQGDNTIFNATASDTITFALDGTTGHRHLADSNGKGHIVAPVTINQLKITDGYSDRTYTFDGAVTGSGDFACAITSSANNQHYVFNGDMSQYSGNMNIVDDKSGSFTFNNITTGTGSISGANVTLNLNGATVNASSVNVATTNVSGTTSIDHATVTTKTLNINSGTLTIGSGATLALSADSSYSFDDEARTTGNGFGLSCTISKDFGSSIINNGTITLNGSTASLTDGVLSIRTDSTTYYVNEAASFANNTALANATKTVINKTMTVTQANGGSDGFFHQEVLINGGGKLVMQGKDLMGWSGSNVKVLTLENGATIELTHSNNETFAGVLTMKGTSTITGSNAQWDLHGSGSVIVAAGADATISTKELRLRHDNVSINVANTGILTVSGKITKNEGNGTLNKSGAGKLYLTGDIGSAVTINGDGANTIIKNTVTGGTFSNVTFSEAQLGGTITLNNAGGEGTLTNYLASLTEKSGATAKINLANAEYTLNADTDTHGIDLTFTGTEAAEINGYSYQHTNGHTFTINGGSVVTAGTLQIESKANVKVLDGSLTVTDNITLGHGTSTGYAGYLTLADGGSITVGTIGRTLSGDTADSSLTMTGGTLTFTKPASETTTPEEGDPVTTTYNAINGVTATISGGTLSTAQAAWQIDNANVSIGGVTISGANAATLKNVTLTASLTANTDITFGGAIKYTGVTATRDKELTEGNGFGIIEKFATIATGSGTITNDATWTMGDLTAQLTDKELAAESGNNTNYYVNTAAEGLDITGATELLVKANASLATGTYNLSSHAEVTNGATLTVGAGTTLTAGTYLEVRENSTMNINGAVTTTNGAANFGMWLHNGATVSIAEDATLTVQGMTFQNGTITATGDTQIGGTMSAPSNTTITGSDITVTSGNIRNYNISGGSVTVNSGATASINSALSATTAVVVAEGSTAKFTVDSDILSLSGDAVEAAANLTVSGNETNTPNVTLNSLTIAGGKTVTLGTAESHDHTLTLQNLTVTGDDAVINANLAISGGTMTMSSSVEMGCDVALSNEELVLTNGVADGGVLQSYTLFTDVESLTLGTNKNVAMGWYDVTTDIINSITVGTGADAITIVPTNCVIGYWNGTVTISDKSVPEPATATLSLLALAGLCARRRRK